MTRPRSLVLAIVALSTAACLDSTVEPSADGIDRALLTPEVAAQLDAAGRFPAQEVEPEYVNQRSRTAADSLARRYIIENADDMLYFWERDRGARIEVERLRRCSGVSYSRSAHEMTLVEESHPYRLIAAGQYWMVFCGPDGRPALRVQVPVEPPLPGGPWTSDLSGVMVHPVPAAYEATAFIGPEEAARLAAGRTSRRVAAVPELINERYLYNFPRWLVRLESPVRVRGDVTFQTDSIDVVVVGYFYSETGGSGVPIVLRPYDLATPEARLDTIHQIEAPMLTLTARLGVPKRVEPFSRLDAPPVAIRAP